MVTCTSKVFLVGRKDNRQFRKTNAVHFIQFVDEVDYQQQQQQPHLYQGSSNPGRSFKVLQSMTQPENAGEFQPWIILIITIRCQTTKKWLDQTYWTMNEEYACVERINENLEKLIAIASISWKFTCTLHSIACYLECLDLANCQTIACTCNDNFQTKYLFYLSLSALFELMESYWRQTLILITQIHIHTHIFTISQFSTMSGKVIHYPFKKCISRSIYYIADSNDNSDIEGNQFCSIFPFSMLKTSNWKFVSHHSRRHYSNQLSSLLLQNSLSLSNL